MAVVFAGAPLVYLASEKDCDYETSLCDAVSEVVELAVGQRRALRAAPETHLVSRLLYYYCMYCLNERTLGEEMVDTIPVHINQSSNGPDPKLLTDARRLTLVGLHAFLPYVHERFLLHWSLGANSRTTSAGPSMRRPFGWLLNPLVEACRTLKASEFVYWLRRVHILLFYFRGHFASFAMRVSGVRLVRSSKAQQPNARYSVLGALLSAELLATALFKVVHKWRIMRARIDVVNAETASPPNASPCAAGGGASDDIGGIAAETMAAEKTDQGQVAIKKTHLGLRGWCEKDGGDACSVRGLCSKQQQRSAATSFAGNALSDGAWHPRKLNALCAGKSFIPAKCCCCHGTMTSCLAQ